MSAAVVLSDPDLGIEAPEKIKRPFMTHTWTDLAMLHWPFEPEKVQALLPPELEVDCFDGAAWVGLIPFRLGVQLPPWLPSIPGISRTLEVNVRTYVRGPDGRRGIWFFSLDAACLPVVMITRLWYRIPYMWAGVSFHRDARTVRYESRRRLPNSDGAAFSTRLLLESEVPELSPLDRFLTCRWRLYSPGQRGVMASQIDHPPWSFLRADPVEVNAGLLRTVGLEEPREAAPHALFSPRVKVLWRRRQHCRPQID